MFLDEVLVHTHPLSWPAPAFRYLKCEDPRDALLAAADTPGRATEARVVIGLDLLDAGLCCRLRATELVVRPRCPPVDHR